ncbi:MAG: hypothetical protein WAM60_12170 [Candidatus Promineifilaceae bacterium]
MKPLDEFGRNYLRLALEIDKHIEGYVDAYTGPEELKSAVQSTPKKSSAALLDDLAWLQDNLPTEPPQRHRYLTGVLRAIDCTVRMLNGQEFDYYDEANRLFDIRPQLIAEEDLVAVHRELDTLLPGSGILAERMNNRRKKFEIEIEQILPLLELARAETRSRTAALLTLPEDESVEIKLTSSQPWSAYNWYLGNGRSLIEFNTDIPSNALALLDTFAHEGYPGHHTEAVLKESLLYWEKGWGEFAVRLLNAPEGVIAEGIATTAAEIIFPHNSSYEWVNEVILPAAGIDPEPVEQTIRLNKSGRLLRHVMGNAAILYHTGQLNKEQTVDYFQTYGLATKERAEKGFSFISDPLFRAYTFTYTSGYDLIAEAAGEGKRQGDKTPIFLHLLKNGVLPSEIGAL